MTELQKLGGVRIVSSVDGIELKPPTLQEQEKLFQPYAEELGRLVFAWNRLHANLARLFWVVTGISSERMPWERRDMSAFFPVQRPQLFEDHLLGKWEASLCRRREMIVWFRPNS